VMSTASHRKARPRWARSGLGWRCFVALLPLLWAASSAVAGAPSETTAEGMRCVPLSGVWLQESEPRMAAVLCQIGAGCPHFVTFVDGAPAQVAWVPTSLDTCALRPVGSIGRFALYYDGEALIGVDGETLQVSWQMALAKVGEVVWRSPSLALLSDERLVLLGAGAKAPTLLLDTPVTAPLQLIDQPERVVLVERGGLKWWPRGADGRLMPVEENPYPEQLSLGDFAVDGQGMVVSPPESQRVIWLRFEPGERTGLRLNVTATSRGVSGLPEHAMAIATDTHVTRLIGRWGRLMQNRYEVKYWRLTPEDRGTLASPRPLVMARGDYIAMDGGLRAARAAILDATGTTWRRTHLLTYDAPGSFVHMGTRTLLTFHPGAEAPLRLWDLVSGQGQAALSAQTLAAAGLGVVDQVQAWRPGDERTFLLRDAGGAGIALDLETWTLSAAATPLPGAKIATTLVPVGDGWLFTSVDAADAVVGWRLLTPSAGVQTLAPRSEVQDAHSEGLRWYGYCPPSGDCVRARPVMVRPSGDDRAWSELPLVGISGQPTPLAVAMTLLALVLAVVITVWRTGRGRKGLVGRQEKRNEEVSLVLAVDHKGRRYVTERDAEGFVHRGLTQLPWRLGLSVLLGAGVAFGLGFSKLIVEPLGPALVWWAALIVPSAVMSWLVLSWGAWNRLYLLRFGDATEGEWYDTGTARQSLCYTLPDGRTFRMGRRQWTTADLVPVVLYDPRRPRFCAQYTGNGVLAIQTRTTHGKLSGNAVTHDLGLMLLSLLAVGAAAGVIASSFFQAFPDDLTSWHLGRMEAQAQAQHLPFAEVCLETCAREGGATCADQCHHRQLHLIFKAAGIAFERDPALLPSDVVRAQRSQVEAVVAELAEAEGHHCDAMATKVAASAVWSQALESAFREVYGREGHLGDPALAAEEQALAALVEDRVWPLCAPQEGCARGEACLAPPKCKGDTQLLRGQLCGLAAATLGIGPEAVPAP